MASNLLTDSTQFIIKTKEYSNPGAELVSGLNYVLALPTGTEIVTVLDSLGNSVNFTDNVVGPISIAPGKKIKLHITIGMANPAVVSCPIQVTGQMQDADDCVLAGTSVELFTYSCISCSDLQECISPSQAQSIRTETTNYTAALTDGVILGGSGLTQVNLPAGPVADMELTIKNIDAAADLTVSGNGKNIDGAASIVLDSLDQSVTVKFDAPNDEWQVIYDSVKRDKDVFTPTVSFATAGDSSFTYNTANGIGYRVGDLYYYHIDLDFDTNGYTTASGALKIDGIPVTPAATVAANISNIGNMTLAGGETPYAEVDTSADVIIGVTTTGAAAALADETHFPASTSNITMRISGFFEI